MSLLSLLGEFGLSASAAFVAYLTWNVYQSPYLTAESAEKNVVIYSDKDDTGSHSRLTVKNIGKIPAKNCRANLWMYGTRENEAIFSLMPVPWISRRGQLIANDSGNFSEDATIGAGENAVLQIFRQTSTNSVVPENRINSGDSVWLLADLSDVNQNDVDLLTDGVLLNDERLVRDNDANFRSQNGMSIEDFEQIEWEEAFVRVESSNGQVLKVPLRIHVSDGRVEFQVDPPLQSITHRIITSIRRAT
ncbi:hypothetical protein [Halobaculum sp. EA56]|uniref:hypothetical protein n=1 Tax=Halobaculum sp. EA56 TaxID=3421648 RepID=UPI003EBD9BA4